MGTSRHSPATHLFLPTSLDTDDGDESIMTASETHADGSGGVNVHWGDQNPHRTPIRGRGGRDGRGMCATKPVQAKAGVHRFKQCWKSGGVCGTSRGAERGPGSEKSAGLTAGGDVKRARRMQSSQDGRDGTCQQRKRATASKVSRTGIQLPAAPEPHSRFGILVVRNPPSGHTHQRDSGTTNCDVTFLSER